MTRRTPDKHWDKAWRDSPYRLRFELGGEEFSNITQPVPRFLQAFDRACTLASAVFPGIDDVTAIVATADEESLHALGAMGFPADEPIAAWTAPYWPDDPETAYFSFRAYRLANSISRDILLWASITQEMPVTPKAFVKVHLVDLDRASELHVYDDRGMDVQAANKDALVPILRQFDAWILDYDRPRIREAFGV